MNEKKFKEIINRINISEKTNLDFSYEEFKDCIKIIKGKIKFLFFTIISFMRGII